MAQMEELSPNHKVLKLVKHGHQQDALVHESHKGDDLYREQFCYVPDEEDQELSEDDEDEDFSFLD